MSKARERVISANGQPLGILQTCKVRIHLGGIDAYHSVLVVNDITQDCLIGVDFCCKFPVQRCQFLLCSWVRYFV